MGFGDWGLSFEIGVLPLRLDGVLVRSLGFRISDFGFNGQDSEFGLGFGVWGLGLKVQGFELTDLIPFRLSGFRLL